LACNGDVSLHQVEMTYRETGSLGPAEPEHGTQPHHHPLIRTESCGEVVELVRGQRWAVD